MRTPAFPLATAVVLSVFGATAAAAFPAPSGLAGAGAAPGIVQVQLVCDPYRCIDPATGAYTQSGCGRRGCYPTSGVVGYVQAPSPRYGRPSYGPRPHYGAPPPYYRPYGQYPQGEMQREPGDGRGGDPSNRSN